jgi:hypothetical protein
MIDKSRWTDEELMIFDEYGHRCVICVFQYADTLHHEPPRSLNPNWENEPWTQYPVCNGHHDALHSMDRDSALQTLSHHADISAPGAYERILMKYATT